MTDAQLLEAVISTLQQIEIKATESNMDKLLGIIHVLRSMIERMKEETKDA